MEAEVKYSILKDMDVEFKGGPEDGMCTLMRCVKPPKSILVNLTSRYVLSRVVDGIPIYEYLETQGGS